MAGPPTIKSSQAISIPSGRSLEPSGMDQHNIPARIERHIKCIVNHRLNNRTNSMEYKVKWKHAAAEAQWLSKASLSLCQSHIAEYVQAFERSLLATPQAPVSSSDNQTSLNNAVGPFNQPVEMCQQSRNSAGINPTCNTLEHSIGKGSHLLRQNDTRLGSGQSFRGDHITTQTVDEREKGLLSSSARDATPNHAPGQIHGAKPPRSQKDLEQSAGWSVIPIRSSTSLSTHIFGGRTSKYHSQPGHLQATQYLRQDQAIRMQNTQAASSTSSSRRQRMSKVRLVKSASSNAVKRQHDKAPRPSSDCARYDKHTIASSILFAAGIHLPLSAAS